MQLLRSRRGAGLVDVIVAVFILGITGLVFSATFPASFSCARQANEYKIATAIAQKKMEQLRSMEYESISQPLLLAAGAIDDSPSVSPYSFTMVDNVATQLTQGEGSLSVTDEPPGDMRRIRVTVSWTARNGQDRSVELSTLVVDKRPRDGS